MFVCQLHCTKEIIMVFYFYTIIWALSRFVLSYPNSSQMDERFVLSCSNSSQMDERFVLSYPNSSQMVERFVLSYPNSSQIDERFVLSYPNSSQMNHWFVSSSIRKNPPSKTEQTFGLSLVLCYNRGV